MKLFQEIMQKVYVKEPVKTVVVNPIDDVSLLGAMDSMKAGLIIPILVGNKAEIIENANKYSIDIEDVEIVNCKDETEVLLESTRLCKEGHASILMKGKIHTDHLMRAVVQRENGLRTDKHISHIFAVSIPTYHKVFYITDAAINIAPSMEQKTKILENAIATLHKLGIARPKVGILSAVENMDPKILGSVDAYEIANLFKNNKDAIVEGPLAFDNVISKKAAEIKKIKSEVAGDVDLVLTPNLEAGNILFKALVYLGHARAAGVVIGAKVPIVLTSRADDATTRLTSCALACAII